MPHHVSNGLEAVVEGFGFRSAEPYFARVKEGTQLPQKQPQPDPAMMKIQGDLEAKKAELQMKQSEVQQNAQIKQAEAAQKAQLETEKMQLEHQRDMERMQAEIGMKRDEMAARIAMERELAEQRLAIDAGKTNADIDLAKRKEETDMAIALAKQEHEHQAVEPAEHRGNGGGEPVHLTVNMPGGDKSVVVKRGPDGKIEGAEVTDDGGN